MKQGLLTFALLSLLASPTRFQPAQAAWTGNVKPITHPAAPSIERVTIPAGDFLMGRGGVEDGNDRPEHGVVLDDYQISKFEVTWEQFQAFIDAGGYDHKETNGFWSRYGASLATGPHWGSVNGLGPMVGPAYDPRFDTEGPPGFKATGYWPPHPNDPVVSVSYWEAEAFCRFVGGRLPSEAEWEKAASWGPDAASPRPFPWGESSSTPFPANGFEVSEGGSHIASVDDPRYEGDVSRYGVRGLGGNIREWVADMYDPNFYLQLAEGGLPVRNPLNVLARRWDYKDSLDTVLPLGWVVRGGSFQMNTVRPEEFYCARRIIENHVYRNHALGFRVAWDADTQPEPDKPVVRETRPGEAVQIPAGSYVMGHTQGMPSEGLGPASGPQHAICLPDYWIGQYEVTWYEYKKFMELDGYGDPRGPKPAWWSDAGWEWRVHPPCSGPDLEYRIQHGFTMEKPGRMGEPRPEFDEYKTTWKGPWLEDGEWDTPPDDHPVMSVSWYEAEAFCNFVGGRLPKEAEWEVAASWNPETGQPMMYPWGNVNIFHYETSLANSGDDPKYEGFQTSPVGMYPEGKSPYGCYDMAGNVFEWCEDWSANDSYLYHESHCGGNLLTPEFLKFVPQAWLPCEPDYPFIAGAKVNRGGGFDPGFLNAPSQISRNRGGSIGDGFQLFQNYTFGFRVAWDRDPANISSAQAVRPPYVSGTDFPQQDAIDFLPISPEELTATRIAVGKNPVTLADSIDVPGKEDLYEVVGPVGAVVEIDLDANQGADDEGGTSTLDAVIEIWHEGCAEPVAVLDDELVDTDDINTRFSYMDPPVTQHRIPEGGKFWVKVRAYYWPAEGSQAGLTRGERSLVDANSTYRLSLTAPGVTCSDPNGDGMLDVGDLVSLVEGRRTSSSKRLKMDLTGDGCIDCYDVFSLTSLWSDDECAQMRR